MPDAPLDPIITKYFDLIRSKTGDLFRGFYYGDPIRIPASMLPAVIGARRATRTSTFTNAEDIHKMTLVFTVVSDVRTDIQDDTTLVPGNSRIYDMMEGRNPDTLALKDTSLLSILRTSIDIDPAHQLWTDMTGPTQVEYGLVLNKRSQPSWSIEASITTVASLVQIR
jgi:hypothetical protein